MKKILFLILISFFFNISESKANKTCIKKKDDGKWPFYYKNYYNGWNTCPLGFKEVSSYEFWAFKEKMDKKYAVSHDPNKVYKTPSESIAKTASNVSSNWRKGLQVETTKPDKKQNLTTSNSLKNFNNNHKYIFNAFVFPEIGTLRNIMGTTTWNEKEVILLLKNGECKFGTDLKKLIKNFDYEGNFDFKCRYHIKNDVIYANIQEKSNVTIYTDKNKVLGQFSRDRNLYNIVKSHEVLRLSQELKMSKLSNLINTKSANLPENNNTLSFSNGDKFIGETKNGKPDGLGTLTWANGDKYVGSFKNNKLDGHGTLTWVNGDKYVGNFKDNQFNGPAYYVFAKTGNVTVAIYKKGKILDGEVEEYNSSGKYLRTLIYGNNTVVKTKNEWIKKRKKTLAEALEENNLKIKDPQTLVVKSGPKKKVEVAKAEEPKQEEFKPENKDVDNQAPIIEVAKNLKFESQTFKFKGRIKDKNKFYLTANGRPVKTDSKGRFEIEGFVIDPEQGEQLKLVAIDQWNNRSEQTVNIEVEFKQVVDARSYEKPNPNKVRVRNNDNKVGIIIGIEKYQTLNNVDAPYANRDANAFRAYANRALGIPNQNLKVLIDNKATRAELLKSLKIWLPQVTRGQQKDVYIFFAGHGLASDDGKDLHILPQDGDPILLEDTAISRVEMFELINKVNPNSVTMFFDTCYSGQTRSEQMLVAGLRPVRIVANDQEIPNNYTIFTASDNDETSGSIEQAEHGIFSYYLMKGLEGNADLNKDKTLTNGELIAYLKNNVSQEAFSQNRQQEPMLSGNPDNILIRY